MSPEKILDFGLELFLKQWGNEGTLDFQKFSQFIKGREENPDSRQKQLSFASKSYLFETLMCEINGLIKVEAYKKAVYHQYKNKTDLFEMLTNNGIFDQEQLKMLYLSLSERISSD